MGAKLSCLVNGISIGDYPSEAPIPPRPVSQQQLSQRQTTRRRQLSQLEYSNEHGEEVPRYRRQCSQLQRPRRQSLQLEDENGEDGAIFPSPVSRRRLPPPLWLEYEYDYDGDVPRFPRSSSDRQLPRRQPLQLDYSNEHGEDVPRYRRQVAQRQLPRRQSLPLEHEYDHDILRHGRRPRRQPTRRQYEIEALPAPMYEEQLAEREDQSLQGSQSGRDEAPPSYEDHVFDRRVDE